MGYEARIRTRSRQHERSEPRPRGAPSREERRLSFPLRSAAWGEREGFVYEPRDVRLAVFDLPGKQLPPRSVQHMSPVKLLASVDADPGFVHDHLHYLLTRPALGASRRRLPM